jgi:hypothetical protein
MNLLLVPSCTQLRFVYFFYKYFNCATFLKVFLALYVLIICSALFSWYVQYTRTLISSTFTSKHTPFLPLKALWITEHMKCHKVMDFGCTNILHVRSFWMC